MTNAERKAEWLAVADHLYNNFSVASGSYLREEAERRLQAVTLIRPSSNDQRR